MTTSRPRVAILDDEPNMRLALGRLLGCRGYDAEEFDSGERLLAACGDTPHRFHAIILDLHMPGMNGFEFLHHLGGIPDGPPVIVITGHDQGGNEIRVKALGASFYLTKPVDGPLLLDALARLRQPALPGDPSQ